MTSHAGHDHPNTKAARAACRRGNPNKLPPMSAEDKARIKAGGPNRKPAGKGKLKAGDEKPSEILTQPHDFVPLESKPHLCKHCGQTTRGRLHDGVGGESRLHRAQETCKHPTDQWVLKGATKKKTGSYYCKCGKYIGDEGPRDLQAKFRF